jgi:hypothetical protein
MDGILQSTFSPLLQYGVLGINTIVFAVVIYYLWTSGNKERGLLMTQITTLQDARVASEHALQTAALLPSARSTRPVLPTTRSCRVRFSK